MTKNWYRIISPFLAFTFSGLAFLYSVQARASSDCNFTCSGYFRKTAEITCRYYGSYQPVGTWTWSGTVTKRFTKNCNGNSQIGTYYGSDDFTASTRKFCETEAGCPASISQVKGYRETEQTVTFSLVSCDQGSAPVCKNKSGSGGGRPHAGNGGAKSDTTH